MRCSRDQRAARQVDVRVQLDAHGAAGDRTDRRLDRITSNAERCDSGGAAAGDRHFVTDADGTCRDPAGEASVFGVVVADHIVHRQTKSLVSGILDASDVVNAF